MAKMKIRTEIEVLDDEICSDCKFCRLKIVRKKERDAYDIEVEKTSYVCANRELCGHILEHIQKEKFLHID